MSVASKFGQLLKLFRADARGTVAIIAGLSFVPMLGAAGAAIDMIRAANVRTQLQNALDAGALAAATSRTLSPKERTALAEAAFAKNWPNATNLGFPATPKFIVNGDSVEGSADVQVPMTIMKVVGIDSLDVNGTVKVSIPQGKKAEIVLVLDYSGSMKWTAGGKVKYEAMRDAAKKLVGDLKGLGPNRAKIGLVPFSHHVWVTLPTAHVKGQSGGGSWTGCTQDRPYPANLSDAAPTASDATKWGWPQAEPPPGDDPHGGCGAYKPNDLIVRPLTDDFASLTEQLDDMRPYAYTHIALGTEFGWHLLSPNSPFEGDVAAYGDKTTEKFLVVLTDGAQTERAFGPGKVRDVAQGEKNLVALCANIKERGITLMTVAFNLKDDDDPAAAEKTKKRLRGCATDAKKNYFEAESSDQLAAAFDSITNQITALAYLSK